MRTKLFAFFLITVLGVSVSYGAELVGKIIALEGRATAIGQDLQQRDLEIKSPIYLNDKIITGEASKLQVSFKDDSVISQGEKSEIVVDEYVFSATKKEDNSCSVKAMKGMFRIITGKITKINPERFRVRTKMATIGIRGCDVGFVVTEKSANVYVISLKGQESITVVARDKVGGGEWDGLVAGKWESPDVAQQHLVNVTKPNRIVSVTQGEGKPTERPLTPTELNKLITAVTPENATDSGTVKKEDSSKGSDGNADKKSDNGDDKGSSGTSTTTTDKSNSDKKSTNGDDKTTTGTGAATDKTNSDKKSDNGDDKTKTATAPATGTGTGDATAPATGESTTPPAAGTGSAEGTTPAAGTGTGTAPAGPGTGTTAPEGTTPPESRTTTAPAPVTAIAPAPGVQAPVETAPVVPVPAPVTTAPMINPSEVSGGLSSTLNELGAADLVAVAETSTTDANTTEATKQQGDTATATPDGQVSAPAGSVVMTTADGSQVQLNSALGAAVVETLTDMGATIPAGDAPIVLDTTAGGAVTIDPGTVSAPPSSSTSSGSTPPPPDTTTPPADSGGSTAPPSVPSVFTELGSGSDWSWGKWEVGGMIDSVSVSGNALSVADYQAIAAAGQVYNLAGVGTAAAVISSGGSKSLVQGSCNLAVTVGGGAFPNWNGSFTMAGGSDNLSFMTYGDIDSSGNLKVDPLNNLQSFSMQMNGVSFGKPHVTGWNLNGNLLGPPGATKPTGAIGNYNFNAINGQSATVNGIFGTNLN